MKRLRTRLICFAIYAIAYTGFSNSVIVQWGQPGGDTNIVSSSQGGLFDDHTTFVPSTNINPSVGADYYSEATDRSTAFNGAFSLSWFYDYCADSPSGDAITFGKNAGMQGMIVWEDFLTPGSALTSLSIEIRGSNAAAKKEFRWLVQQAAGDWFASAPVPLSDAYEAYSVAAASEIWYAFTPFENGTSSIADTPTAISLNNITAVGYYAEMGAETADKFKEIQTRYFQAQAAEPQPLTSYETDYTVSMVRSAQTGSDSIIVASSYEGTVLGMDYDGTLLWTNTLSGYMNRDIWCDDLTGDGTDEILAANADGTIYCLNASGVEQWQFKTNNAPMNAVCVVHDADDTPYVVCGGFDLNIYYLSTKGELLKTIESSSYSIDIAWDGILPPRPPDYLHTANFLRPVQTNGTEILAVQGVLNVQQESGSLYLFEVMADLPFRSDDVASKMRVGDFRAHDPEGDGTDLITMGASVNRPDGRILTCDPTDGTQLEFNIYDTFDQECGPGYRVAQVETIPDDEHGFEYFILYGDNIMLVPPDLDPADSTVLSTSYAYNDLWQDPATGRLILASAQSGGSCIHLIDPLHADWQTDYEQLSPPGKIAAMIANTAAARTQLAAFEKPAWERDPLPVYLTSESTKGLETLVSSITNNYASPIFLNSYWNPNVQTDDWRTVSAFENDVYREKRDGRKNYVLTPQEVYDQVLPKYDGSAGVEMWGGHGNDPYFYQPEVLRTIIDSADGKRTVLTWPEMGDETSDFEWVLNDLFYPLADYAQDKNTTIFLRSKHIYWQSTIYLPMWNELISGEYADVFVSSLEETSGKEMDLSIAARMGLWASGAVDSWGTRAVPDNASYDRLRQFSTQRLPNHFLRMLVYHLSSGAQYLNNFAVDQEYISIFWELIAKGALFVPRPEEIVSFNPVHLSMKEPDAEYILSGKQNKWTTYWTGDSTASDQFVFSRMSGTWPGAPLTEWDFSRYASGSTERRLDFLPRYRNGMVMITPPQQGVFADADAPRGAMSDHLHPLYKNSMTEFITDGRNYYSADGTESYEPDTYYQTVEATINERAKMLPVTVSGDVAWVCAQTDPYHLRLTLIDNGYINPNDRIAQVSFNTVTPVQITDLLDKKQFSTANPAAVSIDVPCGLFRFIDIELSEPFFPDNGWGEFASEHGLAGNSSADHDGDGQTDLHEYAFGGNPTNPAVTASAPALQLSSDTVTLTSTESALTEPGISYQAEWTENLMTGLWSNSWETVTSHLIDEEYQQVERTLAPASCTSLFFRLQFQSCE